jgi:putative resolvase
MPIKVKAKEASEFYSISESNLRKWAREGRIPVERTVAGNFLYLIPTKEDEQKESVVESWSQNIIYVRVSSKKQITDLKRQADYLQEKFPGFTIVKDVGSGINYKRKGFQAILERLFSGTVKKVVVAHQDRWSRFGFDFFQWLFSKFDSVLESVESPSKANGEDLVGDIMEIFTVFSARYYGKRKYTKREKTNDNSEDSDLSNSDSEDIDE